VSDNFSHIDPSAAQAAAIDEVRKAFSVLWERVDFLMPEGADKTFVRRTLRTASMWVNAAIMHHEDGSERK